jgi:hypothetical protein
MQSSQLLNTGNSKSYSLYLYTALLLLLGFLFFRVALIFSYDPEIGGIDNNFVYTVTRMLGGYPMYTNPEDFPFAINLYPPLYFDLCYLVGKIFQTNPENTISVYRLCRSVSFLCDIGTVTILYFILKKNLLVRKEMAILVAGLFSCLLCYLGYTFSRCDSLFLCIYAATFFLLTSVKAWRAQHIFLLSVLCVACLFTKQNGIILPVICSLWLLLSGCKKQIAFFLLFFLLILCAVLYVYFSRYESGTFTANTIKALQNKISWSWFYAYIFKALTDSLLVIPLTITVSYSVQRIKSRQISPLLLIFLLQFFFSLASAFKWGSSLGYFNESFFLSPLVLAVPFKNFENKIRIDKLVTYVFPFIFLFALYVYSQGYLFFLGQQKEKKEEYVKEQHVREYLRPRIKNQFVFNLASPNRTFFKNLFYTEMAVPNFDMVNCCTLPDKNFDYHKLEEGFENGTIQFIIMRENVAHTDIWSFPLVNYLKDTTIHHYDIYRFKK